MLTVVAWCVLGVLGLVVLSVLPWAVEGWRRWLLLGAVIAVPLAFGAGRWATQRRRFFDIARFDASGAPQSPNSPWVDRHRNPLAQIAQGASIVCHRPRGAQGATR